MRVFQIEGGWSFDHLRLSERPHPEPQPGQVLIRMHAASLNARDLIVPLRGYGRGTGELPLIPVSDGVGTVVSIGDGVTRVKVGDRVCPTYFQGWWGAIRRQSASPPPWGDLSMASWQSSCASPRTGSSAFPTI